MAMSMADSSEIVNDAVLGYTRRNNTENFVVDDVFSGVYNVKAQIYKYEGEYQAIPQPN